MNICACMGRQRSPLTGDLFPECPCAMSGKYTKEEEEALEKERAKAQERLNIVLERWIKEDTKPHERIG